MFGKSTDRPAKRGWKGALVWLTLLPILLSMWMIFGFSAQPAEKSSQVSGGIVDAAIRLFVPDFSEMDAAEQAAVIHSTTIIVRKTAHAVEYAMLGFFLQLHLTAWSLYFRRSAEKDAAREAPKTAWYNRRVPGWVWSLSVGFLYAVTDEIHQGFVADRGPRITDVFVDTAGVIAGVALCGLMGIIIRRIMKGKSTS